MKHRHFFASLVMSSKSTSVVLAWFLTLLGACRAPANRPVAPTPVAWSSQAYVLDAVPTSATYEALSIGGQKLGWRVEKRTDPNDDRLNFYLNDGSVVRVGDALVEGQKTNAVVFSCTPLTSARCGKLDDEVVAASVLGSAEPRDQGDSGAVSAQGRASPSADGWSRTSYFLDSAPTEATWELLEQAGQKVGWRIDTPDVPGSRAPRSQSRLYFVVGAGSAITLHESYLGDQKTNSVFFYCSPKVADRCDELVESLIVASGLKSRAEDDSPSPEPNTAPDCKRNVCLEVEQKVLDKVRSLGKHVVFFTSKQRPLRALSEIRAGGEIGVWGIELLSRTEELVIAGGARPGSDGGSVRLLGDDQFSMLFAKNPALRLFVTHDYADHREAAIVEHGLGVRLHLVRAGGIR